MFKIKKIVKFSPFLIAGVLTPTILVTSCASKSNINTILPTFNNYDQAFEWLWSSTFFPSLNAIFNNEDLYHNLGIGGIYIRAYNKYISNKYDGGCYTNMAYIPDWVSCVLYDPENKLTLSEWIEIAKNDFKSFLKNNFEYWPENYFEIVIIDTNTNEVNNQLYKYFSDTPIYGNYIYEDKWVGTKTLHLKYEYKLN